MPRRALSPKDLWTLPRVGAPVPSPDGRLLLVPVATYDLESNEGTTRLWRVPASGGTPHPLTTAEASSGPPAWSPDGQRIAFVRKASAKKKDKEGDPKPQIHVMPVQGGEPERVTDLPLGAMDPRWFPDGKRLAFLAPVARRREKKGFVKAAVTEDRIYRYWDHWLTDGTVHHLFILDLETRKLTDLTPGSRLHLDFQDPSGQYRISPNGKEIAFSACRTRPPYHELLWGVFTLRVPSGVGRPGKPRCLTPNHPAGASRPVYSPDGRFLVYGMQREWDFYADRMRLVAYDRRTRRHRVLTEAWDRSAEGWTFGKDSRTLYFASEEDGRRGIFSLDLRRGGTPKRLAMGGWLGDPQPAGGRIFSTLQSLSSPPEAVSLPLKGGKPRVLTAFSAKGLKGVPLGRVSEERVVGAEGDPVQVFLVRPQGPRPRRGYPLLVLVHGGPHGVFGDQWYWRWNAQTFAAAGYLVAKVNFHGSTSRGQDFAACIHGRWGDQPYQDVLATVDHLVRKGLADPKRMAVAGGSYGGYLVSWIASQTDRFRCLVNHAGVSDLQAQYASDVTHGRQRSMGGEPWDRIEGMDRYNPMRHARGFKTPMLVLHGEKDYRVPYTQGLLIYNVYKAMKRPARLVVYPDENHWILKPANSLHWYGEVLGWLRRWMRP